MEETGESGWPNADFIEDISCIVYCRDVFECGSTAVVNRHIDIEFSYGE